MRKQYIYIIGTLIFLIAAFWVIRNSSRLSSRNPHAATVEQAFAKASALPKQDTKASEAIASIVGKNSSLPKFENLDWAARDKVLAEIRKLDLHSILMAWLAAGRVEHDGMKRQAIGSALGYELQKRPLDVDFYRQLGEFMANDANSLDERGQVLVNILRVVRTKESLDFLVQIATHATEPVLKQTAISAVGVAGDSRGDGKFHEELSPLLERVWGQTQDPQLLSAVASAMAEVGAPSAVKKLFDSATSTGGQSEPKKQLALSALLEVRNPSSIPVFSTILAAQAASSDEARIASGALAAMNNSSAAHALIGWFQSTDASAAPLAYSYATHVRSPAMLDAYEGALQSTEPFRSEENRQAIRDGLAKYRASYTKNPKTK